MNLLTRVLKTGIEPGKDIEGATRAMIRFLEDDKNWKAFQAAPLTERRTWGRGKTILAKRCAEKLGLYQYGVIGPFMERKLREKNAFDAIADKLLIAYAKPLTPALIEPLQGWNSLHKSLWGHYSTGRSMGLSDLGTYNPNSRLPSGVPSDHAVKPAYAFDLGFSSSKEPIAKKFFNLMIEAHGVGYVILERSIWSIEKGLHAYTSGGHETHVHVSGIR